jgi:hypothetical protein
LNGFNVASPATRPSGRAHQAQIFLDQLFQDMVGTRSTASPISPCDVNPSTGNEWTTDVSRASVEKKNIRDAVERIPITTIRKIEAVAAAGREVRRVRAEALTKMKGGLRALYRTLELPGANPLKDAHAALDTAVLNAYGFSAERDLLAQLLSLNQQVAANIEKGESVTAPGVPKKNPDPEKLVTEDCVQPTNAN